MFSTDSVDDRIVKTIDYADGSATQYLAIIAPDFDPVNPLKDWDMSIAFYAPAWGYGQYTGYKSWRDNLNAGDFPEFPGRKYAPDYLVEKTIDAGWYEETTARDWLGLFHRCDPSGIAFIVSLNESGYGPTLSIADDDDESSREFAIAYRSAEDIRRDFMVKRITKTIRARAIESLKGELKTINAYFSGDVYGWQLLRQEVDAEGETIGSKEVEDGSCWGYYGSDEWEYMYSEALAAAERDILNRAEERGAAIDAWRALDTPDFLTIPNELTYRQYGAVLDCMARIQ